jgi:hypothetical protein
MIPESFWQEILPPDAHIAGGYPARFATVVEALAMSTSSAIEVYSLFVR